MAVVNVEDDLMTLEQAEFGRLRLALGGKSHVLDHRTSVPKEGLVGLKIS